jgi:hypothetical protein
MIRSFHVRVGSPLSVLLATQVTQPYRALWRRKSEDVQMMFAANYKRQRHALEANSHTNFHWQKLMTPTEIHWPRSSTKRINDGPI